MIVQRKDEDASWPSAVTHTLAVEAILLGAFALLWYLTGSDRSEYLLYILIALTAVAMGLQSAAVQRLGVPGVMTTYITGTLTTLMARVGRRIHVGSPLVATPPSVSPAGRTGVLAAVFVAYGCGALAGGFLEFHVFSFAVVLPFVLVGIVVIGAIAIGPA